MRYKRFFFITSNTIKWLIQVFVVFFRFRINNLPILFMYGLVYINFFKEFKNCIDSLKATQ